MTEQTDFTPEEALAALLTEVRRCRDKLGAIAGWVTFFGILAIIGLLLGACSAVLGVGGLIGL